jgi:hypothetical protein
MVAGSVKEDQDGEGGRFSGGYSVNCRAVHITACVVVGWLPMHGIIHCRRLYELLTGQSQVVHG